MNGVTRDYTGRQVDLEFLQTVNSPVDTVEMSMSAVLGSSRRVAGIQKAIQRYVALLLTPSDSVPFAGDAGNALYSALRSGSVSNMGYLRHLFNMANAVALDTMRKDDYNISRFGDQPDDERVASVSLSGMTIDHSTSTLGLSLTFRTAAGSDYSYILPITTRHG
jgi:hypothetical protein